MFKSWENLVWVGCFFPDINGSMGTLKFWSTRYWSMAVGFVIGPEIWHLGRLGPFICIIYQQLPFCSYQFCSQTLYIYIVAWSSEITVSRPPMADSIVFDYINISISIWLLSHLYHINTQFYHVIPHLYHIYIYPIVSRLHHESWSLVPRKDKKAEPEKTAPVEAKGVLPTHLGKVASSGFNKTQQTWGVHQHAAWYRFNQGFNQTRCCPRWSFHQKMNADPTWLCVLKFECLTHQLRTFAGEKTR